MESGKPPRAINVKDLQRGAFFIAPIFTMKKKKTPTDLIVNKLYDLLSQVPEAKFSGKPSDPVFVKQIVRRHAVQASSVSAALSIPGGVVGLLSVIPDVAAVWRIQAQMIANVAAAHGKEALVTREQMIWCMFRQMAFGMAKELIVQQGSRYLVKQVQPKMIQKIAEKIGHGIVKGQGAKLISKAVPLVGSVSSGALTYYDTMRVGKNARELYSKEVILLGPKTSEKPVV